MSRQGDFCGTVFVLLIATYSNGLIGAPTLAAEEIKIRVVDADASLVPARAWVESFGQRMFTPDDKTATPYARDSSFSFDGKFAMQVPAGRAVVHIEKGKEFRPVEIEVEIPVGGMVEKSIELKRWIDMPDEGWYSADLHVHLGYDDLRVLKQLALADDVHLVPAFSYWLRGHEETWKSNWPDSTYIEPVAIDERHLITRNNMEIERIDSKAVPGGTVGATFLYNLNRPVTASRYGEFFPTDAALCRVAQEHSPDVVLDSDKPGWAETVIGAALGQLHTIQVCHNHYGRLSTVPGGYGMIGPLAAGESNAAAGDGLFHRTNSLYYRFLNCGFRLGVSGGSAVGVMAMPTGYHRVYVRIDGAFTADRMWTAIKAGRSFATTGPILSLSANGENIGATLPLKSAAAELVKVHTRVRSINPLESLEIIHNGHVVASRRLPEEMNDSFLDAELKFGMIPERSGWLAARALYRAPDGLLRQAHTSPIYLSVDDKPAAFADDARYMLKWIDQLAQIAESSVNRFPDDASRIEVLAVYGEATARYKQIIETAQKQWHDE